jgi:hypothetical protein
MTWYKFAKELAEGLDQRAGDLLEYAQTSEDLRGERSDSDSDLRKEADLLRSIAEIVRDAAKDSSG